MVGSTQGGHPPLQATTSHPVPSAAASRPPEDGRGASLGRNVQPPASATAGAAIFPPRPPSHVSEEMSDVDTDTRVSFYTGTGNEVPRLVTNLTDFFEENKEFSMILGKIWNFNVVSD